MENMMVFQRMAKNIGAFLKSPDYCSRAGSIPASGTIDTAAKKPCCVCLVRCDSLRVCRNDVCDHVV